MMEALAGLAFCVLASVGILSGPFASEDDPLADVMTFMLTAASAAGILSTQVILPWMPS